MRAAEYLDCFAGQVIAPVDGVMPGAHAMARWQRDALPLDGGECLDDSAVRIAEGHRPGAPVLANRGLFQVRNIEIA